jgi:hypothetical protein
MAAVSYRQDTRPLVTVRSRPPFAEITQQKRPALLKNMAKRTNIYKIP